MLVIDHQLKQDRLAVWESICHLKFNYSQFLFVPDQAGPGIPLSMAQ